MAGGSNKVSATADEIAQAQIHAEQWTRYKETGIPLENEYIRRTTGYVMNKDTGQYEADPTSGVRRADGSVVTDTTSANTANEQAYGGVLQQVNPNRLEMAEGINREGAVQGGLSAAEMGLNQQRNASLGMVNAVAVGKGMEGEAMQRQSQLTQQAQQAAFNSAQASSDRRAANSYMLSNVVGVVGAHKYKSKLDSFDPTVTPRTPGDHHP